MSRRFLFKILSYLTLVLWPAFAWSVPHHPVANTFIDQQQDKNKDQQQDKNKEDKKVPKQEPADPDIREVPKARKQSRPPVVVKPNVKVKPIKVIRPKIKKP